MGIKNKVSRAVWAAAPEGMTASSEIQSLRNEVSDLTAEVERLKRDIDELRRDSLRVAELRDLVVESLSKS